MIQNIDLAISVIRELLNQRSGACRRFIQACLVFGHGIHPNTVTTALRRLARDPESGVVKTLVKNPYGGTPWHFYSLGQPRAAVFDSVSAAYSQMKQEIPNELFKRTGEEYVRSLFLHSPRFDNIPQKHRLGRVVENGIPLTLDLAATDRDTGERYGISVKNQNEWLSQGARAIKDCINRAGKHNLKPWLFVPFAMPEAVNRCRRDGIRLTILKRQLLPTESERRRWMRWVIDDFRKMIVGEQPFDFVYSRFSQTKRNSLAVERDLQDLAIGEDEQAT